jgi:hypothetical protein
MRFPCIHFQQILNQIQMKCLAVYFAGTKAYDITRLEFFYLACLSLKFAVSAVLSLYFALCFSIVFDSDN